MKSERFKKGLEIRRKVLGKDHVDRSYASAEGDDFNMMRQDLYTEFIWGYMWAGEDLPLKIRSLITLAMLSGMNRSAEIKLHVRGAFNTGCTKNELRELFFHVGNYCGTPASNEGLRILDEVIAEKNEKSINSKQDARKEDVTEAGRFQRGLEIRRQVLGRDHVDRSYAAAEGDDFNMMRQNLYTEFIWGYMWAGTDLPLKTRSLITLAMLSAMNRSAEIKLHVRGAFNTGCTKNEIRELFFQAGNYCGTPAANEGLRILDEVIAENNTKNSK